MCLFKSSFIRYALLQWAHLKGLIFPCLFRCVFRFDRLASTLLQYWQWNSFLCEIDSVFRWVFICAIRYSLRENFFIQWLQVKLFSPLWLLMCLSSFNDWWNTFLQNGQINLSHASASTCFRRLHFHEKVLVQVLHVNFSLFSRVLTGLRFSSFEERRLHPEL